MIEFGVEDFHIMVFGNIDSCINHYGESISLYEGFDEILTLRSESFLGGGRRDEVLGKIPIKNSHA